ncbi:MAG: transporter [Armatimonadetes bacterium]|nr:transporter [Armatimonadota bacterium]
MTRLAALATLAVLWGGVGARGDNEYPLGVEGIRAATLPPPGSYYRQYNVFYNSRRLNGPGGARAVPAFDLSVYALTHRFVWVSKIKVLGADYACDLILPTINTDLRMTIPAPGPGAIHDSQWGIGDVCLEPLILGWHGKQWDAQPRRHLVPRPAAHLVAVAARPRRGPHPAAVHQPQARHGPAHRLGHRQDHRRQEGHLGLRPHRLHPVAAQQGHGQRRNEHGARPCLRRRPGGIGVPAAEPAHPVAALAPGVRRGGPDGGQPAHLHGHRYLLAARQRSP